MDSDQQYLVNSEEEQVVDLLKQKIEEASAMAKPSDSSQTFIPFYDSSCSEATKHRIGEVKIAEVIRANVDGLRVRSNKETENLT